VRPEAAVGGKGPGAAGPPAVLDGLGMTDLLAGALAAYRSFWTHGP